MRLLQHDRVGPDAAFGKEHPSSPPDAQGTAATQLQADLQGRRRIRSPIAELHKGGQRHLNGARWPHSRKPSPVAQTSPPVIELRQGQAALLTKLPRRLPRRLLLRQYPLPTLFRVGILASIPIHDPPPCNERAVIVGQPASTRKNAAWRANMDAPGLPSNRSVTIREVEIAPVHSDCWCEMISLSLMGFASRRLNRLHALWVLRSLRALPTPVLPVLPSLRDHLSNSWKRFAILLLR